MCQSKHTSCWVARFFSSLRVFHLIQTQSYHINKSILSSISVSSHMPPDNQFKRRPDLNKELVTTTNTVVEKISTILSMAGSFSHQQMSDITETYFPYCLERPRYLWKPESKAQNAYIFALLHFYLLFWLCVLL